MRLSIVASATLSLLLVLAPGLRAQDEGTKPSKPDKEKKDEGEKKKDDKPDKKKGEKGDEGDDDDDDKPKKPDEKLPINPFAKAKKGDWSVCVGKMKANFQGQNVDQKMKLVVRVKKVTEDEVTCTLMQSGGMMPGGKEQKATFALKEMPGFKKFMSMNDTDRAGGDDVEDWKSEDDKKTVGGKEFACKKITAKVKDKMGSDAKLTMWVTDETKGWGVVAMTLKGTIMGGTLTMDVELKGYGNGDTADFGKKPDEEKVGSDDDGDDDAPKKKDKKKAGDDDDMPAPPKKKEEKKKDKKDDDD